MTPAVMQAILRPAFRDHLGRTAIPAAPSGNGPTSPGAGNESPGRVIHSPLHEGTLVLQRGSTHRRSRRPDAWSRAITPGGADHSRAKLRLTRPEWMILLCLFAVAPFLLTFWVHGDGIGYVAYLRSAVVDRDLDLSDEFEHLASHIAGRCLGRARRIPFQEFARARHRLRPSMRPSPILSPGGSPPTSASARAIAWAPAYLIAHGLTLLAEDRRRRRTRGRIWWPLLSRDRS